MSLGSYQEGAEQLDRKGEGKERSNERDLVYEANELLIQLTHLEPSWIGQKEDALTYISPVYCERKKEEDAFPSSRGVKELDREGEESSLLFTE